MANKLKKITSGIPGFDEISHGGIPQGRTTLVSGTSGSGKTAFSAQFLYKGAAELGENGVFVTFEERPSDIIWNTKSFGWDLEQYVNKGIVQLVCHYPEDFRAEQYLKAIEDLVTKYNARRVALDSLSALQRIYTKEKFREFVIGLNAFLKMHDVTSLLTNTTSQLLGVTEITETHLSTATDNIIILKYVELGGQMRRLLGVLKQRGSMHKKELVEFEVTPTEGIQIIGPFEGVENLMSGSAKKVRVKFDEAEAERDFIEEAAAGMI